MCLATELTFCVGKYKELARNVLYYSPGDTRKRCLYFFALHGTYPYVQQSMHILCVLPVHQFDLRGKGNVFATI